jgi:23S rRNA (adenine2503-C2)-methyltransferase
MPTSLLGTSRTSLSLLLNQRGEPSYRGDQVFRWIHERLAADFHAMSDLPAPLRSSLAQDYTVSRPQVTGRSEAGDGTAKWVLRLADGAEIETVFIPSAQRLTLCVSSQVGCAFGCTFCATAAMGRVRDLTAAEIIGQVITLLAGHDVAPGRRFNVVFMGMGEPLDNFTEVMTAFDILTDPLGAGLSWRRITLSTVGHVDGIRRLGARQNRPRLAVSLNATTDLLRSRIMPINKKWPLAALREAMADFPVRPGERITCEYVLMAGETDGREEARRLARLLHGLPARLNLIPWNPSPGLPHTRPDHAAIEGFRDALLQRGLDASIRYSRGGETAAACGQLATSRDASPWRQQP